MNGGFDGAGRGMDLAPRRAAGAAPARAALPSRDLQHDANVSLSIHEIRASRFELLSRLAGDISHEIKNPLHAMVINLELVRRRVEKGERDSALERVAIVEGEIRKVHALTGALLEALRPPRAASDSCELLLLVEELVPLFAARARLARLNFAYRSEGQGTTVPLPSDEARQVLLILLDLAMAASPAHGSVELSVRSAESSAIVQATCQQAPLTPAQRAWLDDGGDPGDEVPLDLRVLRALVVGADGRVTTESEADGTSSEGPSHRLTLTLPRAARA